MTFRRSSVGPLSLEELRTRLNAPESQVRATEAQIDAYYNRHSALALVNSMPAEQLRAVRWYIDCGDDDFLYEGNSLIHIALRKKEVPHEFRIRDGGHTWTYWRDSLPTVLEFVSQAFHQH